jgi:hypothetical protein
MRNRKLLVFEKYTSAKDSNEASTCTTKINQHWNWWKFWKWHYFLCFLKPARMSCRVGNACWTRPNSAYLIATQSKSANLTSTRPNSAELGDSRLGEFAVASYSSMDENYWPNSSELAELAELAELGRNRPKSAEIGRNRRVRCR